MNIITTISDKHFSLNGIHYFKNYISVVRSERIGIFNCYERKDVLVPLSGFEHFSVNGTIYDSASDLQEALIDVLYTRSAGGSGSSLAQNNTGRYISISPRRGVSAPSTTSGLAQYINQSTPPGLLSAGYMSITETNTPVFLASTAKVDEAYYKHVFVFLGGKGVWGSVPHGTAVTSAHFKLLSVTALVPEDIEPENVTELGEISGDDFLATVNTQERDFSEKSHYLSYYTGSILNVALFTGEPGVYGGQSQHFSNEDFELATKSTVKPSPVPTLQQLLAASGSAALPMVLSYDNRKSGYSAAGIDYTAGNKTVKLRYAEPDANVTHTIPAKSSDDTFAMQSDLKLWKAIIIESNGSSIQNNAFVGAASIDLIIANNQLSTEGFTFDPVTGTISGWDVYEGEKHVIFYSKS